MVFLTLLRTSLNYYGPCLLYYLNYYRPFFFFLERSLKYLTECSIIQKKSFVLFILQSLMGGTVMLKKIKKSP